MTCPMCSLRAVRTQSLDGDEWWCPAHGEITERKEPTEEDFKHRAAGMTLNRMFIERGRR